MAAGIIIEAKEAGLTIPGDLAVIGFDDQPIAELLAPKLTTIRQPVRQMGEDSLRYMMSCLEKTDIENGDKVLEAEIVEREST